MKLEYRSKEFYERAFNFSPKIECLLQNQIYMAEMLQEILNRLDWRGSAKEADPTKFESHKPIAPPEHLKLGESDFEKQAKKITERAKRSIEEEPL